MLKWAAPLVFLGAAAVLPAAPDEKAFSADRAIRQLGHEDFKKRTAAQEKLREWGHDHLDEGIERFYKEYRRNEDPEIRIRARELLKSLVTVKVAGEGEGYIGIMMREDDVPDGKGGIRKAVRITAVMEDTPAQKAALLVGDLVMAIDDLDLSAEGAINTFGAYVRSKKPADEVVLHLNRNNKAMDVTVKLMRRPRIPQANMQFFGEDMRIPTPEELEEEDFRAWLQERLEKEKNEAK